IRDRLQNHTLQDVSSKSYDRWNYMPEKRAAMARWDKFVRDILVKKKRKAAFKEAA
ncbi:MAG: site-specific integrase, partial [Mesorhizobium sp.]